MLELRQTEIFAKWESRLRAKRAGTVNASRLARLAYGLPSDVKAFGNGVSELRVYHGPGYRVYFHQHGAVLIVLLCGGNKNTQACDVAAAKRLAKDWSSSHD